MQSRTSVGVAASEPGGPCGSPSSASSWGSPRWPWPCSRPLWPVSGTDTVTNCSGSPSTSGSLPYEVENAAAGDTIASGVLSPNVADIASIDITKNLTINWVRTRRRRRRAG